VTAQDTRSPGVTRIQAEREDHTAVSGILSRLLDEAPADHFTVAWLLDSLQERSFGIILLVLGALGLAPVGSMFPGLLLLIVAIQMMAGRDGPGFPRAITRRPIPTRHLARLGARIIPALKRLEKVVHPRWPTPPTTTQRAIGTLVFLLTTILLLVPVPLGNLLPAMLITIIAVAYIEEDGLLLALAVLGSLALVGLIAAGAWTAVQGGMAAAAKP
jgi:hypothetical protein